MIRKDICFKGICAVDKNSCRCNMVKFLPSGFLWDSQKIGFLTRREMPNSTSLVNFAIFLGSMYYETVTRVVYPALREHMPDTAVDSLDDWLLSFWWDYKDTAKYDFSPDGLFVRKVVTENGVRKIVRADLDLSRYNLALKSAMVRVLNNGVAMSSGFNLERLNLLIKPLRIKAVYSEKPLKENNRVLRENIYLVPNYPLTLSIPQRSCHSEVETINFEGLKTMDLDHHFTGEDLLLDVGLAIIKKVLG